jgi:erythronate-4-phosphate dehydrogenase
MKIVADSNIPFVSEVFSTLGEVTTASGREISPETVRDADVLLVRSVTPVNEALLAESRLRFVGTATIGVDHIDTDYLARQGIGFASAPGSNAISAAEYVTSALLVSAEQGGFNLADKTVAIVGVGNVGGQVLRRLRALGVSCRCYDPPRQLSLADRDYVAWDDVLSADIVTAHVPLTRTGDYPTWRMFNETFFRSLKPGALFINTARGAAVDEQALKQCLAEGQELHLILDVWQNEPGIDLSLLAQAELGTPHIAGYSFDGKVRGTEMIYQALCSYLGTPPQWSSATVLSRPESALIDIDAGRPLQQCLYEAVIRAYDVRNDDRALRRITELKASEQGPYFDRLRKEYPRRREFSQYTIRLQQAVTDSADLIDKLKGLDFQIVV